MGNAYLILLISLFVDGVFGAQCSDPVKTHELMEGESVMLDTCITTLQKEDEIEWKFGSLVIVSIKANNVLYGTDNAIFEDKLRIDDQTGDLTIRNTRTKHSGPYEVKITSNGGTTYRRFTIAVLDLIPKKVSAAVGELVVLQPNISDIQIYDFMFEWMFEDGVNAIARINTQNNGAPWYDQNNERFRGRLHLDRNGWLTINNAKTADSGLYKLLVTGTNMDKKQRRFRVVVDEPWPSTALIVGIVICGIGVIGAIVAAVTICTKRKRRSGRTY